MVEPQIVRANLIISGRVQGVGYRAWSARTAKELGLIGWVKNLADGCVEAMLQGSEKQIAEFVDCAYKGPRLASVEHIDIAYGDASDELQRFEVKY